MGRLVFDIETAADHALPEGLLPTEENLKLGNVKDADKRAKAVEEKMAKAYSDMGLSPLTGKIIAIGYKFDDNPTEVIYGDDEYENLRIFFLSIRERYNPTQNTLDLVTFNGKSFDFPYLAIAAARHELILPLRYDIYSRKYVVEHRDLRQLLSESFGGKGTLSDWALRFGLTPPKGSGKEVYGHYIAGEWDAITQHCKEDVEVTAQIDNLLTNSWW